jgi:hypothetical protein
MKLTPVQIETIREKTGFSPITEEQASESGLYAFFGDNSFYVDDAGVYVFEEVEIEGEPAQGLQPVTAVKIAALDPTGNEGEVQVRSIQPLLTTTTVDIG